MALIRASNPVSQQPSIDPLTSGGAGILEKSKSDNGLVVGRNNVKITKVVRGRALDWAPLDEKNEDFVMVQRRKIIARSGNDSEQNDDVGIPKGGMWEHVGMGDDVVAAKPASQTSTFVIGAALFGLLVWIAKSR